MPILISVLCSPEIKDAEFMVCFSATCGKASVARFTKGKLFDTHPVLCQLEPWVHVARYQQPG